MLITNLNIIWVTVWVHIDWLFILSFGLSPPCFIKSRGEELHFVENGCHDNPTLDVTSDSQSEMQEKKLSANGVTAGADGGSGWQVLVNKPGKEEEDNQEEDTHL